MSMLIQQGAYGIPGIETLRTNIEKAIWWGRFEQQNFQSLILDGSARDVGNTSNTTRLRPGLLLGKITATNKVKEWDNTASDGTEEIFGILMQDQNTQFFGSDKDRFIGWVMVGGRAKQKGIIVPGQATFGIVGKDLEHLVRGQMNRAFMFDDRPRGMAMGGWNNIRAIIADLTATEAMSGTLFTNRGAVGAVNLTLPAPDIGLTFGFYCVADQTITVTGATAGDMILFDDVTADSIALLTGGDKIGGMFKVIGDGTGWLTMPILWGSDGVIVQTTTPVSA